MSGESARAASDEKNKERMWEAQLAIEIRLSGFDKNFPSRRMQLLPEKRM